MQIFPLYNFYNFERCPGTKLSQRHLSVFEAKDGEDKVLLGKAALILSKKKALLCPKPHTI